ncbi:histidine ammonia-lyase [Catenulispora sp. GAS73]|uniref:aromatic amino acid lyase n=1 Tax=Catenulispora sp. GAS73 TaxID=3156269 RepID=UPI003515CF4A
MILIDGAHLTCAEIYDAAHLRDVVTLSADARAEVGRAHRFAERVAGERPVYGLTTGVGANRGIGVTDGAAHARSLLRSHATSAGSLRAAERVRAMLVVRLNQLAAGGSGASEAVVEGLAAMIAADALPEVREHGSIGTGDLTALATTALALIGDAPTTRPLPSRIVFGAHDSLPFISSNAAAIGDAALACTDLQILARASVVIAALTYLAVDGNPEAFAPVVERVTPFEGARRVCGWMRSLTAGAAPAARIQDPFGLRTLPQTLGPALDAFAHLDDVVSRMANAPSENPVVLPGPDDRGEIAHHGGFHAAYLTTAVDTAVITAAQSAKLVLARLATLVDPDFTGLPAFLGDGTPGASGVMVLEYVGSGALGDLRAAATPAGLQTVVLSQGVEEDASFASLAARQALGAVGNLRILLACELVAAVRAVRSRGISPGSDGLCQALSVCEKLPDSLADRDLSPDIELAEGLLPALAQIL